MQSNSGWVSPPSCRAATTAQLRSPHNAREGGWRERPSLPDLGVIDLASPPEKDRLGHLGCGGPEYHPDTADAAKRLLMTQQSPQGFGGPPPKGFEWVAGSVRPLSALSPTKAGHTLPVQPEPRKFPPPAPPPESISPSMRDPYWKALGGGPVHPGGLALSDHATTKGALQSIAAVEACFPPQGLRADYAVKVVLTGVLTGLVRSEGGADWCAD